MLFFQPVHVQGFAHPTSFPGIYSEDDYVNDMAQRAAHDYALAHARVQAIEHQRHQYRHYPHNHQSYPDALYSGRFAPELLDNFSYGFGPASARPPFFSSNRRVSVDPFEEFELAYTVWQEEERQRFLNHRGEALARQRELAREREAQRRRALAEAAAREQQARVAHAARIQARQAHDEQVLLSLLGQLGLAVVPAQSAPVAPQVNRQQPPLWFIRPAAPVAPVSAPFPLPVDRKGKGRAVASPVEVPVPVSRTVPAPPKVPTLKEELEGRLRFETDPDVQESLVLLYSDLFDVREPAQPVAGPSGHKHTHKHVSFAVPVSSASTSASSSPLPARAEVKTSPIPGPTDKPATDAPKPKPEEHGEAARLHRTPALPPAVAAKLLKFYRARRARRLSLAHIKDVEDALRQLEGGFEFPAQLDFVDRPRSPSPSPSLSSDEHSDAESAELAYTANNTPVHAYEHALNDLLTRLDAVESNGDVEIRGRRREVVKEVERALEAMERRIEESRERSRERERARVRRGSVSSQVSDASVTVTPYNVHGSDNVDEVEVAVVIEETPVEVQATKNAVELPAEESEVASDAQNAPALAEDVVLQAEVVEHVTTEESPETTVDTAEPELPQLAVGIPDSGADTNPPPSSDQLMHSHPSSPIDDDVEDLAHPGDDPAPLSTSALDKAAAPLHETSPRAIVEQEHGDGPCPVVQPEAVVATSPESGASVPTPHGAAAPEPISPVEPMATDASLVSGAEPISNALPAAEHATVFVADTASPSERELAKDLGPNPPRSESGSASSSGEAAISILLASTPLADGQPQQTQRRASRSAGDDEVEIIGEDELQAARNESDWSDVGSNKNGNV